MCPGCFLLPTSQTRSVPRLSLIHIFITSSYERHQTCCPENQSCHFFLHVAPPALVPCAQKSCPSQIYGKSCACSNSVHIKTKYSITYNFASVQSLSLIHIFLDFAQKKNRRRISIDEFMDYYRQGDRDAQATIADFVKYMGIGINNILNTFNPDLIVINSSFTMHIPSLPQMLQDSLKLCIRDSHYTAVERPCRSYHQQM